MPWGCFYRPVNPIQHTHVATGNTSVFPPPFSFGIYLHIAMGKNEVLRYSTMSLCRKGGNVANVEIMVYGKVLKMSSLRNGSKHVVV